MRELTLHGPSQSEVAAVVVALLSLTFVAVAFAKSNHLQIKTYPTYPREYQIAVSGYATKSAKLQVLTSASACPSTRSGTSESGHHSFKYVRYVGANEKRVCAGLVAILASVRGTNPCPRGHSVPAAPLMWRSRTRTWDLFLIRGAWALAAVSGSPCFQAIREVYAPL
jgi:hypothetical protein